MEIGDGYNLLHYGTSNDRVAIRVAERFRDKISLDKRKSDQLIAVKIHMGSEAMRAPQFEMDLGDYVSTIPKEEAFYLKPT